MATFKVGQRVRIVGADAGCNRPGHVGREGRVVAIPAHNPMYVLWGADCDVEVDGEPIAARFDQLAPLTDPLATEFIAQCERFAHIAKTKQKEAA